MENNNILNEWSKTDMNGRFAHTFLTQYKRRKWFILSLSSPVPVFLACLISFLFLFILVIALGALQGCCCFFFVGPVSFYFHGEQNLIIFSINIDRYTSFFCCHFTWLVFTSGRIPFFHGDNDVLKFFLWCIAHDYHHQQPSPIIRAIVVSFTPNKRHLVTAPFFTVCLLCVWITVSGGLRLCEPHTNW